MRAWMSITACTKMVSCMSTSVSACQMGGQDLDFGYLSAVRLILSSYVQDFPKNADSGQARDEPRRPPRSRMLAARAAEPRGSTTH